MDKSKVVLKTMTREVLLSNEARCLLCEDVIRSMHGHDFRSCSCGNLSVDGGLNYRKRCIKNGWDTMEELSEFYEEEYAPDWLQEGYVEDFSKQQWEKKND